jgi:hypothetical protein
MPLNLPPPFVRSGDRILIDERGNRVTVGQRVTWGANHALKSGRIVRGEWRAKGYRGGKVTIDTDTGGRAVVACEALGLTWEK